MPSTLEKFGLVHAIRELCDQFHNTSLLPVHFHEHSEEISLPQKTQLMVFV